MDVKQLAELVGRLREAQVAYFRRRRPEDLTAARDLEREVDRAVKGILAPAAAARQSELFTGEG